MNNNYSFIILISLSLISMVNADNSANKEQGEAIIIVDEKTYSLHLQKCYSATKMVEGKDHSVFVFATHQSRKSKGVGPRFSSLGSKSTESAQISYRLQLDGGFSKGGSEYAGKIPFESFNDNKLIFEGEARSLKKKDKKIIKKILPISISIKCF